MALYTINNSIIEITADTMGAELKSIKKLETGVEYLWNGDPKYWGRCAPVLFPIVGKVHNGCYHYGGKDYPMSQHGFARDMEFKLLRQADNRIVFSLKSDDTTRELYPFEFELQIGYWLEDNKVVTRYDVINKDKKKIYFSIGGHPAYMCPLDGDGAQTDYKFLLDAKSPVVTSAVIGGQGTLSARRKELQLKDGYLDITDSIFDDDALIIENNQAHSVALCKKDGKPYIKVSFDAPLFGLWSPPRKNAPFVCIEPWEGRCDREGFDGDISKREWGHSLFPSGKFHMWYAAEIC